MKRYQAVVAGLAFTAAALAACGGGGGGSVSPPSNGGGGSTPGPAPTGVAAMTIGLAAPSGPIGSVNTAPFGVVGGYTQQTYSQVLAFAPGTQITIKNLASAGPHTLNVLSMSSFPASPTLDSTSSNSTSLDASYRSGTINPGASVTVTLSNPGTYYIGCAFHYFDAVSMRDVLIVSASATPGPQATPQPSSGGSTPGPGGGYGY
jgi:plastocyanin